MFKSTLNVNWKVILFVIVSLSIGLLISNRAMAEDVLIEQEYIDDFPNAVREILPDCVFFITNISTQNTNLNSEVINWDTTIPTKGKVCYGETDTYGTCTDLTTELNKSHTTTLSGLTSGRTYHYQIHAEVENGTFRKSEDGTFQINTPDTINYLAVPQNTKYNLPPNENNLTIVFDITQKGTVEPYATPVRVNYECKHINGIPDCDNSQEGTAVDEAINSRHEIPLTNLRPNSEYTYNIIIKDRDNNDRTVGPYSFRTITGVSSITIKMPDSLSGLSGSTPDIVSSYSVNFGSSNELAQLKKSKINGVESSDQLCYYEQLQPSAIKCVDISGDYHKYSKIWVTPLVYPDKWFTKLYFDDILIWDNYSDGPANTGLASISAVIQCFAYCSLNSPLEFRINDYKGFKNSGDATPPIYYETNDMTTIEGYQFNSQLGRYYDNSSTSSFNETETIVTTKANSYYQGGSLGWGMSGMGKNITSSTPMLQSITTTAVNTVKETANTTKSFFARQWERIKKLARKVFRIN